MAQKIEIVHLSPKKGNMATLMSRLIAYAFLAFISSKGLLVTYLLTPGCIGKVVNLGSETSSGDGSDKKKASVKPRELEGRNPKEKNKISRIEVCSVQSAGAVLLSRDKKRS